MCLILAADSNVLSNQPFSADVEEEANSIFQKIFNDQAFTIEEVLSMLKKFRDSSNAKERVSLNGD